MSVIIETERLILRTWHHDDRRPFSLMNADPEVMEFFPKLLTSAESDAFVDRIESGMRERGYGLWATELKGAGRFMGFIGFNYTDFPSDFTPCIEIGWRLAGEFWGMGYATEGARACLDFGFGTLDFAEVYSFTSASNIRSESVMKKIGMKKVKDFKHPKLDASNPLCDHVLYRIAASEVTV
jgi:ribosomal-protein-alanine N-acetyltransferase